MRLDDNETITDQEVEWLEDQIYWYGLDSIGSANVEELKEHYCSTYRWRNCEGCPYYESEDEVCRLDK